MKNRLRVLRAEKGWTQAELAERLGVSRQAVNALETEKHDPSLDLAYRPVRGRGGRHLRQSARLRPAAQTQGED